LLSDGGARWLWEAGGVAPAHPPPEVPKLLPMPAKQRCVGSIVLTARGVGRAQPGLRRQDAANQVIGMPHTIPVETEEDHTREWVDTLRADKAGANGRAAASWTISWHGDHFRPDPTVKILDDRVGAQLPPGGGWDFGIIGACRQLQCPVEPSL
jgi:hypothetical protein